MNENYENTKNFYGGAQLTTKRAARLKVLGNVSLSRVEFFFSKLWPKH